MIKNYTHHHSHHHSYHHSHHHSHLHSLHHSHLHQSIDHDQVGLSSLTEVHSSHRTGNDEDDRDDGDNGDDEDDGDDDVNEDDVIRCHMFLFPRFHSQRCTLLILAMCATKKFVRTRCNPPQHLQEQLER